MPEPVCGNGTVEDTESCDDGDQNDTGPGSCASDCSGVLVACYPDEDGDGYGAAESDATVVVETCPADTVPDNTDCNDDPESDCAEFSYPDNDELCDGCDNDCDAETADGADEETINDVCTPTSGECDTGETLCIDGALSCTCERVFVCYLDEDGDGYGTTQENVVVDESAIDCLDVPGYAEEGGDCDPDEPACNVECVDRDNDDVFDCADTCIDEDNDGFGEGTECSGEDCDDSNADCTDDCDAVACQGASDASDADTASPSDAEDTSSDTTSDAEDTSSDVSTDTDGGSDGQDGDPASSASSSDGCGCSSTESGSESTMLFAFTLIALLWRRRR
jgi:MYXO-CTERM domain-containing protein